MTDSEWTERQEDLWHILDRAVCYAAQAVIEADRANESPDLGTLHSILTAEIMVVEGVALREADDKAWRQVGVSHDQTLEWAKKRIQSHKAARARSRWEGYRAEDLVRRWANHKGRTHDTNEDTEQILAELREIIERPAGDPELAVLIEFVSGTLEEIREVLYRRYADGYGREDRF